MLFSTTYNQITNNSKGIYKAKGSKFIAYAIIVKSEEQVLDEINKIKKLDKNANHYCFAYIIKPDKSIEKVNDDGEPKNSAGKPILGQIKSKDLYNDGSQLRKERRLLLKDCRQEETCRLVS